MLETERYSEAVELLNFLLQCQGEDERTYEEWGALLHWLLTAFPNSGQEENEEDRTEADILMDHVHKRTIEDPGYTEKLMASLQSSKEIDKKLLALGQLAYIDHPGINPMLKDWIERESLHPLIQSKVIQTLKTRGVEGELQFGRGQEHIIIDIDAYPMTMDDFPPQMKDILERVQKISEIQSPALSYFAEETWLEFLFFIYGTSVYAQLLEQDDSTLDVWAAALHYVLAHTMDTEQKLSEIYDLYGLNDTLVFRFEQAHRALSGYVTHTNP